MTNKNLQVFNTDVIPVYVTDIGKKVVLGRELHEKLGIKTVYTHWFARMCEYGFSEGMDYFTDAKNVIREDGRKMPQIQTDHIMTLDMAKHIAMIQRTAQGMAIRQKLIDLEKKISESNLVVEALCNPEAVAKMLMKYFEEQRKNAELAAQNKELEEKNEYMAPRADYCDNVLQSTSVLYTSTDIAKEYGWSAAKLNKILHELHVIMKVGKNWHLYSVEDGKGYVEYKETEYYDRFTGKTERSSYLYWTEFGKAYIYDRLKKIGFTPRSEASRKVREG